MTPQEEMQAADADARAWEQDTGNPDAGRCSRPTKPPMEPIINPAGTIIGYIFNQ